MVLKYSHKKQTPFRRFADRVPRSNIIVATFNKLVKNTQLFNKPLPNKKKPREASFSGELRISIPK